MARKADRGWHRKLITGACCQALLALVGCSGGGDGEGDDSGSGLESLNCAVEVELSGALEHEVPLEESTCAYTSGGDTGVFTLIYPTDDVVTSFTIEVDDITRDELGVFPAQISIALEDGRRFRAEACTVEVLNHEPDPDGSDELGASYRLSGTGTCSEAAVLFSEEGEATLTLGDFRFAVPTLWPE